MDVSAMNKAPETKETLSEQIDSNIDKLKNKMESLFPSWAYWYKIDKNNEETKYIPTFEWIEFPWVEKPEELIKALKTIKNLLPKLIEVFKNNWWNDNFYTWIDYLDQIFDASTYDYTPNKKWKDLYIDNRVWPKDINIFDTKTLSYEWLQKLIPWKDDYFYNQFMNSLAKAINKYTKLINKKNQ